MTFELLLKQIENGKTFEQICNEQDCNFVECEGNQVYEDEALYGFLERIGAKIEEYRCKCVLIITNKKVYEIPYEEKENRFDRDLPNETILFFEPDRIRDVTQYYS